MTQRDAAEAMHKMHVLLLDEDVQYNHLLRQELVTLGVEEIVIAHSPEEAVRLIREQRIDVLVTELYLPLIRFIRTHAKSPNTRLPIVVSTGRLGADGIYKARDAGINALVAKPVSAAELRDHILEAFDKRHHPFIECASYTGPDRRHRNNPDYHGPERRGTGHPAAPGPKPASERGRQK